jgi:hypothetical protein
VWVLILGVMGRVANDAQENSGERVSPG